MLLSTSANAQGLGTDHERASRCALLLLADASERRSASSVTILTRLSLFYNPMKTQSRDRPKACEQLPSRSSRQIISSPSSNLFDLEYVYFLSLSTSLHSSSKDIDQNLIFLSTCASSASLTPSFPQALPADVLGRLSEIVHHMQSRQYQRANDSYLRLSIGTAAWPIGVTMVGCVHLSFHPSRT